MPSKYLTAAKPIRRFALSSPEPIVYVVDQRPTWQWQLFAN